ncbi:MAG TPA: MBL fold metallo-hydrolase [bacterium]|nr:MBL fold metallo-hydrolase [bacterium]
MQIRFKGEDTFEIKSKDLVAILGKGLSVNGFVFPGPGEYEKSGIIINGISNGDNTIYTLVVEDIILCHLGHISKELTEDEIKQIGPVDMLFLPLGADGSTQVKLATKILADIDPRVVVPMLYTDSELGEFKRSEGVTDGEVEIFKVKKSDLPEEERQIVIIRAS